MANQFTLKNGGYEPFIGNYGLVPQPPIPAPESTDEGKVLGVADGAYALVSGGGGSAGLVVNETINDESIGTLDKTYAEIKAAFVAGSPVVIVTDQTSEEYTNLQISNVTVVSESGVVGNMSYSVSTYSGQTYSAFAPNEYPEISYA